MTDPRGLFSVGGFFIDPILTNLLRTGGVHEAIVVFDGSREEGGPGTVEVFTFAFLTDLDSLTLLEWRDFSVQRTWDVSVRGAAAFADGALPFWDPFESSGIYDPGELGLEYSRNIGRLTRDVELALGSSASNFLFGRGLVGRFVNRGQYLRVGHSPHQGAVRFSVRGEWIERFRASGHFDLWVIRNLR